jgi:hypothetical protein
MVSSYLRRKQKSPHGGVVGESRFGVFYMKQKTGFNGVFAPNKAVLPVAVASRRASYSAVDD